MPIKSSSALELNLDVAVIALWKALKSNGDTVMKDRYFHEAFSIFVGHLHHKMITIKPDLHFMTPGAFPYSQDLKESTWRIVTSGTGVHGRGGIVIGMIDFTEWSRIHPEIDNCQIVEAANEAAKMYKNLVSLNRSPQSV